MIEFYPQIKLVHVASVCSSGALFLVRAAGVQLGQGWPLAAPLRYLSYSIDTVLLTSALMLMTVLHQFPLVSPWLTVKVTLVMLYIVLGTVAIKRARAPRTRLVCALGALIVFGVIVSIARTHNPLGIFALFAR
jgi:uncharacterized membrane protein SirB2